MSIIYWKFKNARLDDFSSITFEGPFISVLDLKRAIYQKKKLNPTNDASKSFDLKLSNAQTGQEFADDSTFVPRNTSVIVRRVPSHTRHTKKLLEPLQHNAVIATSDNVNKQVTYILFLFSFSLSHQKNDSEHTHTHTNSELVKVSNECSYKESDRNTNHFDGATVL